MRGELDQSIEFLQLLLFLVLYDSAVREELLCDLLVGTRAFQEGGVTRDLRSPGFQTLFWVHFTWGVRNLMASVPLHRETIMSLSPKKTFFHSI